MSAGAPAARRVWVGRCFVHPAFDYLLIGGGLSLLVTLFVFAAGLQFVNESRLVWILLLVNSAHFASSTVRLYMKPGAVGDWPILTLVFPLVALAMVTLCIYAPTTLGSHLQALYLTWSPYHYAAQASALR